MLYTILDEQSNHHSHTAISHLSYNNYLLERHAHWSTVLCHFGTDVMWVANHLEQPWHKCYGSNKSFFKLDFRPTLWDEINNRWCLWGHRPESRYVMSSRRKSTTIKLLNENSNKKRLQIKYCHNHRIRCHSILIRKISLCNSQ